MFDRAEYAHAVAKARKAQCPSVEVDILDYFPDPKDKSQLFVRVKFRQSCRESLEEGWARQYSADGTKADFTGRIVSVDVYAGELVVLPEPGVKPLDRGRMLLLEPPDFLSPLDIYAANQARLTDYDPACDARFDNLRAGLLSATAAGSEQVPGLPPVVLPPDLAAAFSSQVLRPAQSQALRMALARPFSFVWGPPGTGKSYTLGYIIAALRAAGQKVILVASTNAAVDVTTFAVDDACRVLGRPLKEKELVRYTRKLTRPDEYKKRPHLLAYTELLRSLAARETRLTADLRKEEILRDACADGTPDHESHVCRIAELLGALGEVGEERRRQVQSLLGSARVVAITFTSLIFNDLLSLPDLAAIVVDEASLMPLAVWPYLLHRRFADRVPRFVVAGDPLQLQPIKPPSSKELPPGEARWFNRNLYADLGVGSMRNAMPFMDADTLAFLDYQSRMKREICSRVSAAFYDGRLSGDNAHPIPAWSAGYGIPSVPVCVLDPGTKYRAVPGSFAKFGTLTSYRNIMLVVDLVDHMIMETAKTEGRTLSVLVLSPFRDQAKAYSTYLSGLAGQSKTITVRASTVYKAQGSEADVVIFDLVDAGRYMLTGAPDASSVWCVACSRAKSQLIVVGDPHAIRIGRISGPLLKDAPVVQWAPADPAAARG